MQIKSFHVTCITCLIFIQVINFDLVEIDVTFTFEFNLFQSSQHQTFDNINAHFILRNFTHVPEFTSLVLQAINLKLSDYLPKSSVSSPSAQPRRRRYVCRV